jgi:hypothetical protein
MCAALYPRDVGERVARWAEEDERIVANANWEFKAWEHAALRPPPPEEWDAYIAQIAADYSTPEPPLEIPPRRKR